MAECVLKFTVAFSKLFWFTFQEPSKLGQYAGKCNNLCNSSEQVTDCSQEMTVVWSCKMHNNSVSSRAGIYALFSKSGLYRRLLMKCRGPYTKAECCRKVSDKRLVVLFAGQKEFLLIPSCLQMVSSIYQKFLSSILSVNRDDR